MAKKMAGEVYKLHRPESGSKEEEENTAKQIYQIYWCVAINLKQVRE
jgi:hypothetical protein